jgi:hypothetical protein
MAPVTGSMTGRGRATIPGHDRTTISPTTSTPAEPRGRWSGGRRNAPGFGVLRIGVRLAGATERASPQHAGDAPQRREVVSPGVTAAAHAERLLARRPRPGLYGTSGMGNVSVAGAFWDAVASVGTRPEPLIWMPPDFDGCGRR